MGPGPVIVTPGASETSADGPAFLTPETAKDVQGIVVSAFPHIERATALFLDCTDAPGGGWLAALRAIAPITAATGKQTPAAMIAFTRTGLERLGVPEDARNSFQLPFQEGMFDPVRRRRLGDDESDTSRPSTITKGGLAWSGNTFDQDVKWTPQTVHALVVIYDDPVTDHADNVAAMLLREKVAISRRLALDLRFDGLIAREHFGFADGISQPIPYDKTQAPAVEPDPIHGVPLGEILLGHVNAHGEIPPGPIVRHRIVVKTTPSAATQTMPHADADTNPLARIDSTAGLHDLGLNGSYLVVRELRQDVAAFWTSLDREAAHLNARAGGVDPSVDADWLAARVVGRDKDGHLLGPSGPWPALAGGLPDNAPLFFKTDRLGFGCPIGSHVRRANPRDGLAATPDACPDLLRAANAHRILRRGRKFGETAVDPRKDDGVDRGLLFMCLNTDIVRQFEFVQQNWLLNPNFGTLFKEVDPLVGPAGPMTLPKAPLRRVADVETYVTLTGGDYFFLPSLRALAYFETLPGPETAPAGEAKP